MGWYKEVTKAVYLALCAVFDMEPNDTESMKRFVPAYISNATNAQAPRNMDICYFALSEMQESGFDYIQLNNIVVNGVPKTRITKTIPVSVLLTFYGDNADDDAENFWSEFQWDSGSGSARAILRKLNIAPIGKPDRPVALFETEGTFHRRRCDVRLYLSYLYVKDRVEQYVDKVPDIFFDHENDGLYLEDFFVPEVERMNLPYLQSMRLNR